MRKSSEDIADIGFILFVGALAIILIIVIGAIGLRLVRWSFTPFDECTPNEVVMWRQIQKEIKK